jgi:hypothetical protein
LLLGEGDHARFSTFYYFATALSTGVAAMLPIVPLAQIGRRFFVLMSLICVVLVALAVASSKLELGYFHVAFAGLLILYNIFLPGQRGVDFSGRRAALEGGARPVQALIARFSLWGAILCGVAGVIADGLNYPLSSPGSSGQELAISLAFLSSSVLLGGALTAMVLGHWYLVARQLSFAPFRRMTLMLMAALLLRLVSVGAAIAFQGSRWEALIDSSGWTGFWIGPGVFLLARALFGFLAPMALVWLTWRCLQLRSNQSATGILYVTLAFVLMGEIIAKYFLVSEQLVI